MTRIYPTHYIQQNQYGVLAYSPDDFINSRNLIPLKFDLATPYSMTNIGLRISLPLIDDSLHSRLRKLGVSRHVVNILPQVPEEVAMAALNCRKDGDFFHFLALPLWNIGRHHYVRHPKKHPVLLPMTVLDLYENREIFIQNEIQQALGSSNRHLALIFQDLDPAIAITDAYPPAFWNSKEKILQGRKHKDDLQPWHACLRLLITTRSPHEMVLVLGVNFTRGHNKPWCTLIKAPRGVSLEQVHGKVKIPLTRIERLTEGVKVQLNKRPGNEFEFSPVIGALMCTVHVTVPLKFRYS
jgi:hypothetical protein